MQKLPTVILCWLLSSCFSFAQIMSGISIDNPMRNEWLIKFAPLAIFDTDGGVNFSGEYIIPKIKLGFQVEAQAVLFDVYRNKGSNNGFDAPVGAIRSGAPVGIKLRPEVRYYIGGMRLRERRNSFTNSKYTIDAENKWRLQNRTYLAVDLLYKNIHHQRLSEFSITNGGTQPAYQQRAIYTDIKQVFGFDFKIGFTAPLAGEHWLTDLYLGLGVRYKKFRYRNLPKGASEPQRTTFGFPRPTITNPLLTTSYPSFPMGIKKLLTGFKFTSTDIGVASAQQVEYSAASGPMKFYKSNSFAGSQNSFSKSVTVSFSTVTPSWCSIISIAVSVGK